MSGATSECSFISTFSQLIIGKIMKKIMSVYAVLAASTLTGCAVSGSSANGPLERWDTFGGKTISEGQMGDKQSRVVFMREAGAIAGPAVNVFVDGDYLTSLLDGGYRSTVVCSTGEKVLASFNTNQRFANRDAGIDYNFVSGETAYVKVMLNATGQPVFQRISPEEGTVMMSSLKEETQTLPRVKPNRACEATVLEKITLQAHSLFKFDKYTYKNMLPEGRQEISDLGEKINNSAVTVDAVKVVGYTDPMGSAAYNLKLSQRRAATVKRALQNAGVKANIEAEGLGKSNLVVKGCSQKFKGNRKARIACDQPNRRVEIILYGNKKN